MRKFIAYDKDTLKILGFISNDYSTLNDTKEIFAKHTNCEVIEADNIEIPTLYSRYKLVFEEGLLTGIELIQTETNNQEEV